MGVGFRGVATACGINEKGLVENVLSLAGRDYGNPVPGRPTRSIGGWAQYVLDSHATVAEAVMDLERDPFTIVAPRHGGGSSLQNWMPGQLQKRQGTRPSGESGSALPR